MRMPALRAEEEEYTVVLGPCPGCESWQLDYTYEAAAEFAVPVFEDLHEFGSAEPVGSVASWDSRAFHEVVEDLLQEHLAECPHLQLLLEHS